MYKTSISAASKSKVKIREHKGKSIIGFPSDYVVVDIETTGLNPSYDEIIELAAIRVVDNVQVDTFSSLVKPMNPIGNFITDLTGITNDMVSKAPTIEDILPKFSEFVGSDIVVGHNVNFDINFIYDNLMGCSQKAFDNDFIDLLRIARKALPELDNHKLKTVSNYFNVNTSGAHRGLKDCEITDECFNLCKEVAAQRFGCIDKFIKAFGQRVDYSKYVKAKDVTATNNVFNEKHVLYNRVCVFTGSLEKMPRKEAMQAVLNAGGRCGDGLTKKTNYLIVGSVEYSTNFNGKKSTKVIKAERYISDGVDIKIISETTFVEMLKE